MADSEREDGFANMREMGWVIARTTKKGYTIFHCPCGDHSITFSKTPSNPNHYRERVNHASVICCHGDATEATD
ncbi:MAG TPA: hypothetical protein VHC63_15300 [Acidimicrobiales bacterium]|nr:hypothetical protein [Acidimicrobiales bacterium]